jgi:Mg-chelatase subunit ChlD
MRRDLADITLVVDRSGSMGSIRDDAEGGVNAFIADQAKEPTQALLTLVQFDTEYEFVHNGLPIEQVPKYELNPRGSTALLDAVGRAISETGQRLARMPEADRPGLVIFVVMTDGHENSSKEFTKAQIKELIERQQNQYQWHFTFLGANQDAFAEAGGMGIHAAGVANYSKDKVRQANKVTSDKVARMRSQFSSDQLVSNEFTEEERRQML